MQNRNNFGILLVSGALALSAIGVALLTQNLSKQKEDGGSIVAVQEPVRTQTPTNTDSDGDGLPNWKEVLYKTDPLNPDTDGDGISDFDEIEKNTSPVVFGDEVLAQGYVAPKALPPSEALARELFSGYAGAQTNVLTSAELEGAIDEMLDRQLTEVETSRTYELSDINVSQTASLSSYIGAVDRALSKAQQVREYELSVFARIVEKNRGSDVEKLRSSIAIYKTIQEELLALDVPQKASTQHVIFMNSMEAFIASLDAMVVWDGDPFSAIVLVGRYGAAEDAMVQDLLSLYSHVATLEVHS